MSDLQRFIAEESERDPEFARLMADRYTSTTKKNQLWAELDGCLTELLRPRPWYKRLATWLVSLLSKPKRARFIYISGPYTTPDPDENTRIAISAADPLLSIGYFPYVPHTSHFWHRQHPHEYEVWMALDIAWLSKCDAIIRIPGESPGADREVQYAREHGISVYYSVDEFLKAQAMASA